MYKEYDDFYLHVGWPDDHGRYPIHILQSPCGETKQPIWQENKLKLPAYQHILDYLGELIAEPDEVEILGKSLHEFLFPPEVNEIFHRCREDKGKGLRIRLRIDPEELSLLPWEYCYDPKIRQFLALERQTPIVRYIAEGFAAPSALAMPHPVRLLVVLAAPKDQPPLDMEREEDGIREALRNVPVDLTFLRHATIDRLHDMLLQVEPNILHFSGHGVVSDGFGALALENPLTGNTDPLTARQMRSLLNRMGINLAVLNACETARHDTRDALMGVAQALVREEIPAVIAMQFLVSESVALMFTRRLYDFLFRGDPLEKIVTETRVGIDINSENDRISWGIPVLFMRARDGYLWQPESAERGSGLDSLITTDLKTRNHISQSASQSTESIFLKKVYRQWVIDILARSIPNAERRIEFLFHHECDGVLLKEKSSLSIFDELDQALLLLGAPGSGKTIALCELARDLIQSSSRVGGKPLPVILRLATWRSAPGLNLEKWIDEQLKIQYGMGKTHIEEIKPGGFLLMLDGLDEVRPEDRISCVKAINEYCEQNGWLNIVITCRADEYADLKVTGHGLKIPEKQVVSIAPLERSRIDAFLNRLDRVGIHVDNLYSLLANECTPLMTDVILQTYEGKSADHMEDIHTSDIWEKYIERKFEDEYARRKLSGSELYYSPDATKKWLGWLARQLRNHTQDQNRFFTEEIQPNWLSKSREILSYGLTFFVLLAVAFTLVQSIFQAGLLILFGQEGFRNYLGIYFMTSIPLGSLWIVSLIWVFARRSASYRGPIVMGLLSGIAFGSMIWVPYQDRPALAVIGGAVIGAIVMALVRIVIKVLGYSDKQIVCVKRRKWDWTKAGSGFIVGIIFVFIISLVSDITRAMFFDKLGILSALNRAVSLDTVVWWNWGLPGLLSMSLFFFMVFGLGWGDVVLRDDVDLPNQGIIDSGRNGLIVTLGGILTGLIFSLAIGLPCYLGIGWKVSSGPCEAGDLTSLTSGLGFGLVYGLILGLIFGMIFGGLAWVRHYLLRILLFLDHQQIPWRLGKFLQYAANLRLLRRVGGGFEFIDQELQAYFERLG